MNLNFGDHFKLECRIDSYPWNTNFLPFHLEKKISIVKLFIKNGLFFCIIFLFF